MKNRFSNFLDRYFFCARNGHLYRIMENMGVKHCLACHRMVENEQV